MDYEKLYKKFVLHRREKEKLLKPNQYTELHHIVPLYAGGKDEEENRIRLIPEDHFFAHLLLAKAHGGNHWMPIHKMLHRGNKTNEISYKDFANKRKRFGLIRRMVGNTFRETQKTEIDKAIYTLKNRDGKCAIGDRAALSEQTGLHKRFIDKLVRKKVNTVLGWYYPEFNPEGLTTEEKKKASKKNQEIITLFHFNGDTWSGTKGEFHKRFGKQLTFKSETGMCCGWFKTKEAANAYVEKRTNISKADTKLYEFEVIKTGQKVYHSKASFAKAYGVSKEKAFDLITRRVNKLKGMRLSDKELSRKRPYGSYYEFIVLETKQKYKLSIPEMSRTFGVPAQRLHKLVKGKIKVIKKYGITLAKSK